MLKFCLRALAVATCLSVASLSTTAMAAPPANAFGELPKAWDGAISPDGKRLAVITNRGGEYVVLVQPIGNSTEKRWVLPLGDDLKPRYVKWINNERFALAVRRPKEHNGTPYSVGYLFSADYVTRDVGIVVKPNRMFRQFNDVVVDWLEDDPDHILMAYSDEQFNPYPDIKKVEVATGKDKTVVRGKSKIERWYTDPDGVPVIGQGQNEKGTKRMVIRDPATGKWREDEKFPGLTEDTPIYTILKGGRKLVIGDYNGRDTIGLYVYDLEQKRITREVFHNDDYDVSSVVLSKDGEEIIGAKYTGERDQVELLGDYGTMLNDLRKKFSDYDVDYIDQTDAGDTVLFRLSAPYDPGGMYIYSYGDEYPSLIVDNYSELTPDDMGEVVALRYTARDGQKIPAFVTLPPTIKPGAKIEGIPFIVLPHGGPYARDSKRFDYFAQFFATRGYGVLQMNFRGSEGYGKSFADAGRDNWVVMQEDVEDGMKFLLEKGYADPDRTCIAGWSYGGYAALMGAAKAPELYSCVIAMAALTDISAAKDDLKKYRGGRAAAKKFFGESMKDRDVRKANSPVHVADQITVPVFLAHGDQDQNVQFSQYERMRKALKKAGVKTTLMPFEEEDHFLSRQDNREEFFKGLEKFLKQVNGPSEYQVK